MTTTTTRWVITCNERERSQVRGTEDEAREHLADLADLDRETRWDSAPNDVWDYAEAKVWFAIRARAFA